MRRVAGISGWSICLVGGGSSLDFLGFLEFSEYFLENFGELLRILKNFAMLSGGWKEGMVWLQDFLKNENGPSDFL